MVRVIALYSICATDIVDEFINEWMLIYAHNKEQTDDGLQFPALILLYVH